MTGAIVKLRTAVLLAACAALTLEAQPAGPARGGPFGGGVRSPEVAADGKVTFRLRAPNAKEVFVTGIPGQRLAMLKDEQGLWTATSEPLKPDIYTYSFSVDGATFTDPGNPRFKTAYANAGQSLLHVPGAAPWHPQDGPRGAVTRHFYKSAIVGDNREFYVYTPPNYDATRGGPYPVLFLLHGLGDDASAWLNVGAANVILDNLINQGKAKPMIMVNTLGYGTPEGPRTAMAPGMIPAFAKALVEEVLAQVEKAYRVARDRNQRAIAGLSMGGAEALYTGLNYLDRFSYIGSFSGAFVMWPRATVPAPPPATSSSAAGTPSAAPGRTGRGPQSLQPADFEKTFPALTAKANSQLRLVWIACGTEDGLNGVNRQFKAWLKSKEIQFTDLEIPAYGHVWPLWRQNLAEFAPLLFQKGK
jgi:enterochelin esterase family protein